MKKNIDKKDLIYLIILTISFFAFVLIITQFKYFYGSTVDWHAQHIVFPDYFRELFYDTKNLFPDFAFNIGNGQNIYNFSYYGLFSPIVLISYFLPFINMTTYMVIATIVSVLISAYLLYFWLKKKKFKQSICFVSSFLFLFSACLTFHSHRHIMFINYMPFLIMGLYGVDKKLEEQKGSILALAVFLMILTSYYFSIGGLIALVIYGIYKYYEINKKISFTKFIKDGINFAAPFIIGILSSAILILPTFYVILSGRGETFTTITLKELLIPMVHIKTMLYDSYGIGLTSIILIAIISLFDKEKEHRFLAIFLTLTLLFPLVSYILNATMYIDAKSLIPLLPLCILTIATFIDKIFNENINYKRIVPIFIIVSLLAYFEHYKYNVYILDCLILLISISLYHKLKKEYLFIIPICLFAFFTSLTISKYDGYILKNNTIDKEKNIKDAINYITDNDSSIYRINGTIGSDNVNRIYNNIKYYNSTLYSSTYNMTYNKFYFDIMNNNIASRNRVITASTNNLLFNIFSSHKYLINSTGKQLQGYELIKELKDIKIYKNENVLPLGYATSNVIDYDEFEKMSYPYNQEALLNNIIADTKTNSDFVSNIKKVEFDQKKLTYNDLEIKQEGNRYLVSVLDKGTMTYKLDKNDYNKIIFLRFNVNKSQSCSDGDIYIDVNSNRNKLTCEEWKYHNQNYLFDYVIADTNIEKLDIKFSKGNFDISDIEIYSLDYAYLESILNKVTPFEITKLKANKIEGNITLKEDGYFTLSIPYDNGFECYVDDELIKIEKVNTSFIGFPLKEGSHKIKITYHSPLKNIGIIISLIGVISFILVWFLESKRKI